MVTSILISEYYLLGTETIILVLKYSLLATETGVLFFNYKHPCMEAIILIFSWVLLEMGGGRRGVLGLKKSGIGVCFFPKTCFIFVVN